MDKAKIGLEVLGCFGYGFIFSSLFVLYTGDLFYDEFFIDNKTLLQKYKLLKPKEIIPESPYQIFVKDLDLTNDKLETKGQYQDYVEKKVKNLYEINSNNSNNDSNDSSNNTEKNKLI